MDYPRKMPWCIVLFFGCFVGHEEAVERLASLSDLDGDGFSVAEGDCDDNDVTRFPNALEICDEKDNDCDGLVDEAEDTVGQEKLWAPDGDGDGFAGPIGGVMSCARPAPQTEGPFVGLNWVDQHGDCDDSDPVVSPISAELWENALIDNDCDGVVESAAHIAEEHVSQVGFWDDMIGLKQGPLAVGWSRARSELGVFNEDHSGHVSVHRRSLPISSVDGMDSSSQSLLVWSKSERIVVEYSLDDLMSDADLVPMKTIETQGSIYDAILLEVEDDGALITIPWAAIQEGPLLYLRSNYTEVSAADFDANSVMIEKIAADNGQSEGFLIVDTWRARHFSAEMSELDEFIWEHNGELTWIGTIQRNSTTYVVYQDGGSLVLVDGGSAVEFQMPEHSWLRAFPIPNVQAFVVEREHQLSALLVAVETLLDGNAEIPEVGFYSNLSDDLKTLNVRDGRIYFWDRFGERVMGSRLPSP